MRGKWIAVLAATSVTLMACGGSSSTDDAAGGATTVQTPAIEVVVTTVAAPPTTQAPTTTEPEAAEPLTTDAVTEVTDVPVDDTFPPLDTEAEVDTDFSGEGSGPFCDFIRELNSDDPISAAFDATDPAIAKAAWSDVVSTFDKLEGLAPDEVRNDVTTLAGIFDTMQQYFAGYDFDMEAASLAMENEPEMVALFSGEDTTAQDASDRLDAYGTEVCGLAS